MPQPPRFTRFRRVTWFLIFWVAHALLYLVPNFHPVFEPRFLPLTFLDSFFSFIPWTFWVYLSAYGMVLSALVLLREHRAFVSFVRVQLVALIVCAPFFYFFPTVYPRPPYPDLGNPFLDIPLWLVAHGDTPNNCFPSLHVALMWNLVFHAWRALGRRPGLCYGLWALAISLSTLTTKQHYVVDIIGGFAVAALVQFTAERWAKGWVQGPFAGATEAVIIHDGGTNAPNTVGARRRSNS